MHVYLNCIWRDSLTNQPPVMTTSQTIDLVNDQLVIVGFNTQTDTWQFISLDDSRGGLQANQWISNNMIGRDSPRTQTIPRHVSYVEGQHLNILGGNQNRPTQIDLSNLNTLYYVNVVRCSTTSVVFANPTAL